MKLLRHIVCKDALRVWPWLVLQLIATAAHYAYFEWLQARGTGERFVSTGLGSITSIDSYVSHVLFGIEWFAWIVVCAALVQEDAVASDRAFWRTRPISRHRLLAAKATGLLCLGILLPLVPKLFWWWHNDFGFVDFRIALFSHLAIRGGLLLVVWAIAAGTAGIGSFITGLLVAGLAAMALLVLSIMAESPVGHEEGERLGTTRLMLCLWITISGAGIGVWVRYASARGAYLLYVLVTTATAALVTALYWPVALRTKPWYLFEDPSLGTSIQGHLVAGTTPQKETALIHVTFEGVPSDYEVRGMARSSQWLAPSADGLTSVEKSVRFYHNSKESYSRETYLSHMPAFLNETADDTREYTLGLLLPSELSESASTAQHVDLKLSFALHVSRTETVFDGIVAGAETTKKGPFWTTVAFNRASNDAPAAEVLMRSPSHCAEIVRFVGTGWNENNNVTSGPKGPIRQRENEALYVDFVRLQSYYYRFTPAAVHGASLPRLKVAHRIAVCEFWPTLMQQDVLELLKPSKP